MGFILGGVGFILGGGCQSKQVAMVLGSDCVHKQEVVDTYKSLKSTMSITYKLSKMYLVCENTKTHLFRNQLICMN